MSSVLSTVRILRQPRLFPQTAGKVHLFQMGASLAAESLATGQELLIRPEHAVHVLEIMLATRKSQKTGQRIALKSKFPWPVVV